MSKKIPHRSLSSNEESVQSSFLHIPSDLFNDFSLSLEEERILAIIRSYGGSCYWSVERFAKYCRCSVRQTLRAIQKLEKSGRIQKKNRGSLSNLYSEIPLTCQTGMMTNWHDDKLAHLTCQPVTMNMTNCHNQHDSLSPYIDKDNKTDKDNYNNSTVADAPLPTETELKDSLIDLEPVKEPLETLAEPESSGGTHPPQVSPPPLPKKKKAPSRKTSFPSPEYWEAATPKLIEWAIDNGADDSAAARWVQEKIIDMGDSAAAKGYQFIDWVAAFRKWYRRDLPKGSGPEADIRKATVWLWNHTHGERMEKPPASPVVVTAVRKTLEQLGKSYLTALGETEEKWRELKLKELRQMIHDNLEAAQ